ncbi:hypothetical protein BTHI11S_05977 [Bosea thiooxidans]
MLQRAVIIEQLRANRADPATPVSPISAGSQPLPAGITSELTIASTSPRACRAPALQAAEKPPLRLIATSCIGRP